jgi:hypothetical protein
LKSSSELPTPTKLRRGVQAGPDDLADALGRLARAGKRVIWVRQRVERALREREPGPYGATQAGGQELSHARL